MLVIDELERDWGGMDWRSRKDVYDILLDDCCVWQLVRLLGDALDFVDSLKAVLKVFDELQGDYIVIPERMFNQFAKLAALYAGIVQ